MSRTATGESFDLVEFARSHFRDVISQLAAAGALIVLFIYLTIASDHFATADNLFNVGVQVAVTAIVAIGQTFVIITAGIDLSVGSVSALAGVIGTMLIAHSGIPVIAAIILAILIGGVAGLVNGTLVTLAGLAPFIATLGMLSVARGLVDVVTNATAVFGLPTSFDYLGQGQVGGVPIPIIVLAGVAIAAHLVLTRTRLGRYTYAIGSNPDAARLSGIPVKRYLNAVYVISGLLAGLGGIMAMSRVGSGQPNFGLGLELDAIAAAVIGGTSLFGGEGTIPGTLIGAFLIALIRNGSVLLNINTFVQSIIIGCIIWLAVLWDQVRRRRVEKAA